MSSQQPRFSPGADTASMEAALTPLLTTKGGRWVLAAEGEALEREFKFKTFAKTWVRYPDYSTSYHDAWHCDE
jgi:4a-hydroxytetrahydrobiopterin dehydratase